MFRGPASQLVLRPYDLGPTTQQSGTFGDPNTNFTEILLTASNQPGFPDDVTSTVQVLPDAAAAQQTFAASFVAPPPGIQTRVLQSPNIGETSSAYQKVDNGYVQVYARVKNVILGAEAASSEDAVSRVLRIMADRTVASLSVANGWESGPNAQGAATIAGSVGVSSDADAGAGTLTVSGSALDVLVTDGPGIDGVRVYDGSQTDSAELAQATIGVARPDVAATLNNQAWATTGFSAQLDPSKLAVGQHTLVVAAHSPSRGWWSTTLTVDVAATATPTPTALPAPTASAVPDVPVAATDSDSPQPADDSEEPSQPTADPAQVVDTATSTPMPTVKATAVPTSTPTAIATVLPTPQAAVIEGPYHGSLAEIGFKPDDFGAGWTVGAQSVDHRTIRRLARCKRHSLAPVGYR